MTASAEIIDALDQSYGSAASKAGLAAIFEGEGGVSFRELFSGGKLLTPNNPNIQIVGKRRLWTGSLDAFPDWGGVELASGQETRAAGAGQFEPRSYAGIVTVSGRSAFNDQDQIQNTWDYASQVFVAKMPMMSLHTALATGGSYLLMIPTYLGKIWPGGCDSGFPKRFVQNLPLVSSTTAPASAASGVAVLHSLVRSPAGG